MSRNLLRFYMDTLRAMPESYNDLDVQTVVDAPKPDADIEHIIGEQLPDYFNDDKGPRTGHPSWLDIS